MVVATSYAVGDAQGWVTGVDYSGWTSGKSFTIGDTPVFIYVSKLHIVIEVSQGGYPSCSGSNALANDDSGATTVVHKTPDRHYDICNIPDHCASSMKLAVTIAEGGSSPEGSTPSAGGSLVPAMGDVVIAAVGALVQVVLL